jgi:hypothetical protein
MKQTKVEIEENKDIKANPKCILRSFYAFEDSFYYPYSWEVNVWAFWKNKKTKRPKNEENENEDNEDNERED